jgi:pyruvate formate lyase activating enzyme
MVDIKCIDDEVHKKLTGKSNKNVLEMIMYLNAKRYPIWIRHVLVPTITDDDELLSRMDGFIKTLDNVQRVEVLPYHTLGIHKYEILGIKYPLEGVPAPSQERVDNANKLLHTDSYTGYLKK